MKKNTTTSKNYLTKSATTCYNNQRTRIQKLAADDADHGYFDTIDPYAAKILSNANKLKSYIATGAPAILAGVNMVKDKLSPSTRNKLADSLRDYAEIAESARPENTPYTGTIDDKGNFLAKATKDSLIGQMTNEYTKYPETQQNAADRRKLKYALAGGSALGSIALYLSTKNKKLLNDPRFGSLLDSAGSAVSQKTHQRLLGAAMLNNATVVTTPLAAYYTYKNRDDKNKRRIGKVLTALSGMTYLKTNKYLREGPMHRSIQQSFDRLSEMAEQQPQNRQVLLDAKNAVSDMYHKYRSNAQYADAFSAAASIPLMYGAENFHKLKTQRLKAEIQGDSGLSESEKAKKIKDLSRPSILSKYPYLQGMPFAAVLDRRINPPNNN